MPDSDERVDALYGLPLEEFVGARDALAKDLRSAGDRDGAAAVRRLPKPTRAAWAVNLAVRAAPSAAGDLAEAARVLADAQQEALAGGGPAALREAAARARSAVDALAGAAPDSSGPGADKVRATLHAATVDPDVLAEVAAGRVVRERSASGFGGLEALAGAPSARTPKAKAAAKAGRRPAKEAAAPAKPPRDDRRRRERLRRAKEAEAEAQADVSAARSALEQVEAALAARRTAVRDAEARLKDARQRRERAER